VNPGPTVVLARATARLREAGVGSPQAEARTLLLHASALSATGLLVARELPADVVARYEQLIDARCAGTPVQHLTGLVGFRAVVVAVGPGVFVPRPETELVAGAAIEAARAIERPLVVELCAGSGAISAAMIDEVPGVRLFAVESDEGALRWLRRNLAGTGASVVHADMADALAELDGQVDVVVANPPYISWAERDLLPADVRDHDPPNALFADEDGLAAIRVVIGVARRLLRPGGQLVVEHGDQQSPQVVEAASAAGFGMAASHRDLTGRARYVTALAPGSPMQRLGGDRDVEPGRAANP